MQGRQLLHIGLGSAAALGQPVVIENMPGAGGSLGTGTGTGIVADFLRIARERRGRVIQAAGVKPE